MRFVGFSTGALARSDVDAAIEMLSGKEVNAIELSALRQNELEPLVNRLDTLKLNGFDYISFHAPSAIEPSFEIEAVELLQNVFLRGWPIIVHPDAMYTPARWAPLGSLLCIENMDKRKSIGQTASDLASIFESLPDATLCFDIGHARQVDPTMSEAVAILARLGKRLQQLHVSDVNTQSKHDPLTLESEIAFRRVAQSISRVVPIILESRVEESGIDSEIENALRALDVESILAIAGD